MSRNDDFITGFICGFICMAILILSFYVYGNINNRNKVEHFKTGDIEWVCIRDNQYGRSCDIVQQDQ